MSFIDFVEQEQLEKLDPFLLFDELSKIYDKPLQLIITAFIKKFKPNLDDNKTNFKFYSFDSIKGLNELVSYKDMENCTEYLRMIVDGYSRIVFTDDYDITKEYWGLEHKESNFSYMDSFGQLIPHTPFYFKRSEIKLFLEYSNIPIPSCITQEKIKKLNDNINNKDGLEEQLEKSLDENNFNLINNSSNVLSEELLPYKSRITINSWEAASLIVNNTPNGDWNDQKIQNYKNSILNAVKNNVLSSTELNYDINGELCYAEINIKDIGLWAKKHAYNWPLPIDEDTDGANQYNSQLLQRINQLEQELEEHKKVNSESIYVPPLSIDDTDSLVNENNQLKIDKKNLTEQLNQAKKEIEELKNTVPIFLGKYKNDDLLLLAIKARDKYWGNYTDSDPNFKPFSSEKIRRSIKKDFNHLSDRELNAIEFVSCPINRKK